MTITEHTSKALSGVLVNAPEVIAEMTRAHDRADSPRLQHLYEAQRLCLDMLTGIQTAILTEQSQCAEAAVPVIAARIKAAAQSRVSGDRSPCRQD
jgi:hypothetical protein